MKLKDKIFNWYFTKKSLPYWGILLLDILAIYSSGLVAYMLLKGMSDLTANFIPVSGTLALYMSVFCLTEKIFHVYDIKFRYSSLVDLQHVVSAMLMGATIIFVVRQFIPLDNWLWPISGKVVLMGACLSTLLLMLIRIVMKAFYDSLTSSSNTPRAIIYGVHDNAENLAHLVQHHGQYSYRVCGFLSDNRKNANKYINGNKIYYHDEKTVEKLKKDGISVLICDEKKSEKIHEYQEFVMDVVNAGIKILLTSHFTSLEDSVDIKEVEIEDLLPRDQIDVDMNAIGQLLADKSILITGAAGSIGSEMVRQIAIYKPKMMILIDQAETPLHAVMLMLNRQWPEQKFITLVSSITKSRQMENLFMTYRPDYVFHAAAYKHVPMMEMSPANAVQNNCIGTRVIADLSAKYGVKKFVMISTDKAVNPTNVMGCTKRICEIYCQSLNSTTSCEYITTRFGNVLGSNGSVIPIFKEQIKNGGPVTVTHPDIVRYFMLIPEACKLVLQAGTMGHGGEIYAFDMGEPVRIADLAQKMIDLSGAKNVRIDYVGLRDGEKLYEEVMNELENSVPTSHRQIRVAKVREYRYDDVIRDEEELEQLSYTYDEMAIVKKMKSIVPEFKSMHSRFEVLD